MMRKIRILRDDGSEVILEEDRIDISRFLYIETTDGIDSYILKIKHAVPKLTVIKGGLN